MVESVIDRELLEMSAKAYGIELDYRHGSNAYYYDDNDTGREQWNPLDDDGQALRLASYLEFEISLGQLGGIVYRRSRLNTNIEEIGEGDYMALIRRAIVRAAAEIGRQV